MDMSALPSQHTKKHKEISFTEIMALYDYHPWDGGNNPRIDKITNTLLNLKNSELNRRTPAVNFFTKVLTNPTFGLSRLIDLKSCLASVVPSHSKNNVSPGLLEIIKNISDDCSFEKTENLLRRTKTVAKAATGGPRNQQIHLDSIAVTDTSIVQGETVFLFDDITSTGSSLLACKQLLLEAGAARVVMIALGKTYMDH
ncbi:phosphoribosyltransferase family protein [Pseudomonas sp. IT-232MI5]|uniref:phosphoribosyltransferase family protein n=1 Tax=Pseudomonas sp. IT-232MI5 TaxID=3026442 RepID=UPI0039E1077B